MKKIVILIVIGILTAIGYALFVYFQPVKDIAKQKTDIQLTVQQLTEDFNKDAKPADEKYKNKVVELSGTIKKTEVKDSICTIIFDNGGNYIIIANCVYETKNEVERLKEGNEITIKGIYSGFIINDDTFMIPAEIKIDKCTLLK